MNAHRTRGITLVELLVAIAIFVVVFGAIAALWVNANRTTDVTGDLTNAQRGVRTATARFSLDAMAARGFTVVQGRDEFGSPLNCSIEDCSELNDDVAFETILRGDEAFTSVWYYVDAEGFLVREIDGLPVRLVPNVESLRVSQATGEYLELLLASRVDGRTAELVVGVAHRN